MPDRTQPPPIKTIFPLQLPQPVHYRLDNGIPVYEISMGTQEVTKIEIVFRAGRPYERQRLAARATASLIKEGSRNMDSATIAEKIDFYGATLSTPFSLDTSRVILYTLNRYIADLLPVVAELVQAPAFPEHELATFIKNSKQRLQVDLAKNDVVAYREVTGRIFGEDHPYGYNSLPADYDALQQSHLIEHYSRTYTADNCTIFVSGRVEPGTQPLLNRYFGQGMASGLPQLPPFPDHVPLPQKERIPHPDNVQTAIRMGCRLFNRKHADFAGCYVLNTILGGYFGSRLMANIREEKGYTYNIFSTLDAMHHDGYFYIGTEVGNTFVEKTMTEIYREMRILQEKLVTTEEMEMVRNYLLGNLLTMLDGPFNVMDVTRSIIMEELPEQTFPNLINTIRTITPETIRELAKRYLNPENMWEIIVG